MDDTLLHDSDLSDAMAAAAPELTTTMLRLPRLPLAETIIGSAPIAYCLWVNVALYFSARWPFYTGSAEDGRRRLKEHIATYSDAVGIPADAVQISYMYTSNLAVALWAEATILDHLQPVANCVLKGSGCKGRGSVRAKGNPTPFRILHPRANDLVDFEQQRLLRRQVVEHLTMTAPPEWVLDRLAD